MWKEYLFERNNKEEYDKTTKMKLKKRRGGNYSVELAPPPEHIPWYKSFKRCFLSFVDRCYWMLNQPISIRISVVGPRDGGKTSLIRRYAGDIFYEDKFEPPVDSTFQITSLVKVRRCTRRFNVVIDEIPLATGTTVKSYDKLLGKSDVGLLFVYSVDEPDQEREMTSVINRLKSCRHRGNDKSKTLRRSPAVVMVAGNKSDDTVDGGNSRTNWDTELKNDLEAIGIDHFNVSAKNNSGVCEVVNALIEETARNKMRTVFSSRKGAKALSSSSSRKKLALLSGDGGDDENDTLC